MTVERLLQEAACDVNAAVRSHLSSLDGQTPLHIASAEGHEEVVRLLLAAGADVEAEAAGGGCCGHTLMLIETE